MTGTPRPSGPPTNVSAKPTPPVGGWPLLKAATILCPREADIYSQGGEALQIAASKCLHRLSTQANREPEIRGDAWLTLQVLDKLRDRLDLQLTGRKFYDVLARRVPIQPDIIRAACERDNNDTTEFRRWVQLDFRHDLAGTGVDVPSTHLINAQSETLREMRIERLAIASMQPADQGSDETTTPGGDVDQWREWYPQRRAAWPIGKLPPTEAEDRAEGMKCLGIEIPRRVLRAIRNEAWGRGKLKSGPRSA